MQMLKLEKTSVKLQSRLAVPAFENLTSSQVSGINDQNNF